MRRPRVKICGLTRAEDVGLAVELGADAVGFIFAQSRRQLSLDQARALAPTAPAWVNRVGVFGPWAHLEAAAFAETCRLDTLQFHGAPDLEALDALRSRFTVVQAIGVGADDTWRQTLATVAPHVDAILLDTARPAQLGGNGEAFDWSALDGLTAPVPVLVAGGLNAGNVGELLARHAPYGVDVASGVESAPGIKDATKLQAFFAAIRQAG
jgi:phosphoribosylanthranilate isomerase